MTDLCSIAKKWPTDKYGHHNYTPIYDQYLNKYRHNENILLEHGIGGYQYPDRGGGGLSMWSEYMPFSNILGTDIYPKSDIKKRSDESIYTYQGSQNSETLKNQIISEWGAINFIVDDASHNNYLTINTFKLWWPHLSPCGIYFIEDVHTSYWDSEEYQGDDSGDSRVLTTMNFFKNLTDVLNWDHIEKKKNYEELRKYVNQIKGISFYKELIVIEKI